jgi:hypothetical protein
MFGGLRKGIEEANKKTSMTMIKILNRYGIDEKVVEINKCYNILTRLGNTL